MSQHVAHADHQPPRTPRRAMRDTSRPRCVRSGSRSTPAAPARRTRPRSSTSTPLSSDSRGRSRGRGSRSCDFIFAARPGVSRPHCSRRSSLAPLILASPVLPDRARVRLRAPGPPPDPVPPSRARALEAAARRRALSGTSATTARQLGDGSWRLGDHGLWRCHGRHRQCCRRVQWHGRRRAGGVLVHLRRGPRRASPSLTGEGASTPAELQENATATFADASGDPTPGARADSRCAVRRREPERRRCQFAVRGPPWT